MYARVPQAMAQFVLKIEKLSHIMAPTPILEMARLRSPSLIIAPDKIGLCLTLKKFTLTTFTAVRDIYRIATKSFF